jgi:hypothetical protein
LIDDYPRTAGAKKKNNTGQLPFTHPIWKKLANPNHCNCCMARKIYNWARVPQSKSMYTTAGTESFKKIITYTVHEYKTKDFATFTKE